MIRRSRSAIAEPPSLRSDAATTETEDAIAAYEKVVQDESLGVEEETAEVDWISLAHFRLGQCQAMLGEEERALQELSIAAESGPTLEDLAGEFSGSYQLPDGLVRAWGAVQRAGLYQKVYEGQAGNLGAPVDAFQLLFPGGGVAATTHVPGTGPAIP